MQKYWSQMQKSRTTENSALRPRRDQFWQNLPHIFKIGKNSAPGDPNRGQGLGKRMCYQPTQTDERNAHAPVCTNPTITFWGVQFFPENPKFGQNENAYIPAPNQHETPKRFHNCVWRGVTMSSRQNDPNNQPTALHKRANWENDQRDSSFGKRSWRKILQLESPANSFVRKEQRLSAKN